MKKYFKIILSLVLIILGIWALLGYLLISKDVPIYGKKEMAELRISAIMQAIDHTKVIEYLRNHGDTVLNDDLSIQFGYQPVKDPWERFHVLILKEDSYRILSLGEDGIQNTEDDILLENKNS